MKKSMAEAGCDLGLLWGENMSEQFDVRTGSGGGKAYGLAVQMLLELSVRGVVTVRGICIFHPYVIG